MTSHDVGSELPSDTLARVLDRLGIAAAPPCDPDGLRRVYRAWCAHIPFDNLRKMVALRGEPGPLPGGRADDFFESWLVHGSGGTCWPTSNALFALLAALGFPARRVAGSMHDVGVVNHGSVKVGLDGRDWLVDSSMLTNEPLPLTDAVFCSADPVFPVEVEAVEGTHRIWTETPPNPRAFPCRLLVDPADRVLYAERYEASRQHSPFNQRLYARRNLAGELVVLFGSVRHVRSASGVTARALSREELRDVLLGEFGYSEALVARWTACGALEASFQERAGPSAPPPTELPPSRRGETPRHDLAARRRVAGGEQ